MVLLQRNATQVRQETGRDWTDGREGIGGCERECVLCAMGGGPILWPLWGGGG